MAVANATIVINYIIAAIVIKYSTTVVAAIVITAIVIITITTTKEYSIRISLLKAIYYCKF